MVRYIGICLLFVSIFSTLCAQKSNHAVSVIFDTDMGPDYDDVGALAVLHALADNDEAKILVTVASNRYQYTVPCIEIINNYFGRPSIPLGEAKTGLNCTDNENPRWTDSLVVKYPYTSNREIPDAVDVYRKILSEQTDRSVTIISVGFLTNLSELLKSKPDQYSRLNGLELIRKKVKMLAVMGGMFPEGKEYNFYSDTISTKLVCDQWPSEILFSGFEAGYQILTGKQLINSNISDSPVIDAYAIRMRNGDQDGRYSWDQLTVWAAIRNVDTYFNTKRGTIHVASDGSNTWEDNPNGSHCYLQLITPPEEIANIIEKLMMHNPKNK